MIRTWVLALTAIASEIPGFCLAQEAADAVVLPAEQQSTAETIPVDQQAQQNGKAASAGESHNAIIEEIVVTAQKREENLQNVPISIQAFSAGKLEALGVTNAADLPRITPGLVLTQTAGFASTFIRGLGTDAFVFADPSVAFYTDGVYNPAPTTATQDFGEIQRIEVLKGPQGTLFGRNAIGGAVNIITRPPSFDHVIASANGSYEDYGAYRSRAYVSIPITHTLAFSLSGLYNNGENYIKGSIAGHPLPRNIDEGGRFRARWMPADFLEFSLGASVVRSSGLRSNYAVNTTPSPLGKAIGITPQDPYGGELSDAPKCGFREVAFNGQAAFYGNWFDAKLIGGAQRSSAVQGLDFGGSQKPVVLFAVDPNISHTFSGELQLVSNDSSWLSEKLKWIVGAYYFNGHGGYKDTQVTVAGTQIDDAAALYAVQLPQGLQHVLTLASGTGAPNGKVGLVGLLDTDSKSGYAQASYNFTDWVSLTLGARYQDETRKIAESQAFIREDDGGKVLIPGQDFSCAMSAQWCSETKAFSPKLGLDFHILDDALVYTSWQKATKSGTFNTLNIYDKPDYVKPEKIAAYEIGLKTSFLDRQVRVNSAAFYYNLRDLQTQFVSLLAGGAITFENAPAAEVMGGEFDAVAELFPSRIDDLVLTANAVYLDAKYTDFPDGSGFNETTGIYSKGNDYSGHQIVRSPRVSGSVGLNKTFRFSFGNVDLGTNYYSTGGYYFLAENHPQDREKSYGLLGATVALDIVRWHLRIAAFGENMTSAKYDISRFAADFGTLDARAPKAVYGLRLKLEL